MRDGEPPVAVLEDEATAVWAEARAEATRWLAADPVFLDVETTGLGDTDQVVEIAIIDARGVVLLDTLVRPTVPVSEAAAAIHGISADQLASAPTWDAVISQVRSLLDGSLVICHGAHFDASQIDQSCQANGLATPHVIAWKCTLHLLTPANDGHRPRLSLAMDLAGATRPSDGQAHRAAYDAECCRRIVCALATARPPL